MFRFAPVRSVWQMRWTATAVMLAGSAIFIGAAGKVLAEPPPRAVAPFDANAARAHQAAWAKHLGTSVETIDSLDLRLVLIPPGEFLMGSSPERLKQAIADAAEQKIGGDRKYPPTEGPQHRVVLTRPFRMSVTEITVGQFRRFLETSGYKTETERLGGGNTHRRTGPMQYIHDPKISYAAPGYSVTDDSPATQVTWNDAVEFCDWLTKKEADSIAGPSRSGSGLGRYRLPTEAEWEFACRAGTTTEFSHGDDLEQLGEYAWYGANQSGRSQAVGTKRPNPFGLFDMHGNTREWCADWYGAGWYKQSPTEDPIGPESGEGKVLRGGKWLNKSPFLRSAFRFDMPPSYRSQYFGFRVVCERYAE